MIGVLPIASKILLQTIKSSLSKNFYMAIIIKIKVKIKSFDGKSRPSTNKPVLFEAGKGFLCVVKGFLLGKMTENASEKLDYIYVLW
jgi:hypothetical protein